MPGGQPADPAVRADCRGCATRYEWVHCSSARADERRAPESGARPTVTEHATDERGAELQPGARLQRLLPAHVWAGSEFRRARWAGGVHGLDVDRRKYRGGLPDA